MADQKIKPTTTSVQTFLDTGRKNAMRLSEVDNDVLTRIIRRGIEQVKR